LHVGLHKTATTTLQADIFPNIEGIRYLGRKYGESIYGDELYEDILRYSFGGKSKYLNIDLVRNKINQALNQSSLLISEEWFTSDYDSYSFRKGLKWQDKIYRLAKITHGLPVKLLVTTREPIEAIFSFYCEMLQVGLAREYENFYHFAVCDNSALVYRGEYLDSLLLSAFGESPNYINIQELKNEHIHKKLSELFGVEVFCDLQKRYTKERYDNGVEIIAPQCLYKNIRSLWLSLPSSVRKKRPATFYQNIRRSLYKKYSNKSIIPNPTEEELSAVRRLLLSEKTNISN